LAINLTQSTAKVNREVDVAGDVIVNALGKRSVNATAKAAVNKNPAENDEDSTTVTKNNTNTKETLDIDIADLDVGTVTITALPSAGTLVLETNNSDGTVTTRTLAVGNKITYAELQRVKHVLPLGTEQTDANSTISYTATLLKNMARWFFKEGSPLQIPSTRRKWRALPSSETHGH
jgi:hypothetical protein